jgi:hypothetical protein
VGIPLLKDSRSGDRAIVFGNLLQTKIEGGKKECLNKSLLEEIFLMMERLSISYRLLWKVLVDSGECS